MKKIKEDAFNIVRFMLNNGKDVQTIIDVTGLSAISIDRIEKAETYAEYDAQRKERSARIIRNKEKNDLPKQIGIDDLIPGDPMVKMCEAIAKNTDAVERLIKQISDVIGEMRGA